MREFFKSPGLEKEPPDTHDRAEIKMVQDTKHPTEKAQADLCVCWELSNTMVNSHEANSKTKAEWLEYAVGGSSMFMRSRLRACRTEMLCIENFLNVSPVLGSE